MDKRYILVAALVMALVSISTRAESADHWYWKCGSERLTSFWEEGIQGAQATGRGRVCETPRGVWSTVSVRNLAPDHVYTAWWVYIDQPELCAGVTLTPDNAPVPFAEPTGYAGRCGLADFFTPDASGEFLNPLAVFGRMDSAIVGHDRRAWFSGDVPGLKPSPGSQVWVFVFGHGPADESDVRQLARQLLTPEDPASGAPHLGIEGRPFGYPAAVLVVESGTEQ